MLQQIAVIERTHSSLSYKIMTSANAALACAVRMTRARRLTVAGYNMAVLDYSLQGDRKATANSTRHTARHS